MLVNQRLKFISAGLVVVLISVGVFYIIKSDFLIKKPKQIYEIAVMISDQYNPDPVEDARTSLKAGDVIVVQKEGHSWSMTEKTSYLILKLELTEEQAAKLTSSKEREMTKAERRAEEEKSKAREQKIAKEEKERLKRYLENRKITVLARQYRIKLESLPKFDPLSLAIGQPYLDRVYGWEIVEKKK